MDCTLAAVDVDACDGWDDRNELLSEFIVVSESLVWAEYSPSAANDARAQLPQRQPPRRLI